MRGLTRVTMLLRWMSLAAIPCCTEQDEVDSHDPVVTQCAQEDNEPCRGALPICAVPPYGSTEAVQFYSFNNCPIGQYYTTAVVENFRYRSDGASFDLVLSDVGCVVNLNATASLESVDEWSWLHDGATLTTEFWDPADGSRRGGDPMWLVLEDPSTEELLLAVYAGNDVLIRNGTVSERLTPIDVALDGPTCEYEAGVAGAFQDLVLAYELTASTVTDTFRLAPLARVRIPLEGGTLNVATGALQDGYALGEPTIHGLYGSTMAFSVWPSQP